MPQKGQAEGHFFLIGSNGAPARSCSLRPCQHATAEAYGFDPCRDIQVLCPTKVGPTGSVELNRRLQDILNPPAKGKGQIGTAESAKILRLGDKVMQVKKTTTSRLSVPGPSRCRRDNGVWASSRRWTWTRAA